MKVYQCINKVQAELAKIGIAKSRTCQQGASFKYRGIDEVYNTLAPMLSAAGLCILPRILSRTCDERQSAKGNALFYVVVHAEFDIVCAEDGSKHVVSSFGEAMDSGDKATNKAMSIAFKSVVFMMFCVPTEGDNDPDAVAHTVAAAMTEEAIEAHQMAMHKSRTIEELQSAWSVASAAAKSAGDTAAFGRLKAFCLARRATLAPEGSPA